MLNQSGKNSAPDNMTTFILYKSRSIIQKFKKSRICSFCSECSKIYLASFELCSWNFCQLATPPAYLEHLFCFSRWRATKARVRHQVRDRSFGTHKQVNGSWKLDWIYLFKIVVKATLCVCFKIQFLSYGTSRTEIVRVDPDPGEVSIEKSEPFTGAADTMDLQATFSRYTFYFSLFITV